MWSPPPPFWPSLLHVLAYASVLIKCFTSVSSLVNIANGHAHSLRRPYPKPQRPPPAKDPNADPRPRLLYYIGIDKRVAPALTAQQLLPNGQVAQVPTAQGAAGAPAGKVDLKQPCMIFVNEVKCLLRACFPGVVLCSMVTVAFMAIWVQVTAWASKRPGMELRVNVLRRAQLPQWLFLDSTQQQRSASALSLGENAVQQDDVKQAADKVGCLAVKIKK